ncbi:Uncharacterised protein [Clostridioides difficile]|nr:Uncharacterised protein [Clostridioides difficile]
MECKFFGHDFFYNLILCFILTIWNVNGGSGEASSEITAGFILTIWNVNANMLSKKLSIHIRFILTIWNVNVPVPPTPEQEQPVLY